MSAIFARGSKLYAKIKGVDGAWKQVATGFSIEERAAAERWVADQERKVSRAQASSDDPRGELTVTRWIESWLDKRTNVTASDDRTRMRLHVLPRIGTMRMPDVRSWHIDDLIGELRNEGVLAPSTIRSVGGLLHTAFKRAAKELGISNPVAFERGTLPKKVDKDPTWRREAIYTRDEIETLISDERLLADRRVLYALKSIAALRHTEAATLTWGEYDEAAEPLGSLNLAETKTDIPRRVPVHPTLAAILGEWRRSGWEATYGRAPLATDLIVPTRRLAVRAAAESQKQLLADLDALGFRKRAGKEQNRRGHDMRRTMITLARTDGANKDILRGATHGPNAKDMMDLYSSFDWATLCAEVAKLRVERRESHADPAIFGAALVQPAEALAMMLEKTRPQRDSNPCRLRERQVS